MKDKHKRAHLKAALAYAECSTAVRLKVGAVIVKDNSVISIGYNGTPPGWDNTCEQEVESYIDPKTLKDHNQIKPDAVLEDGTYIVKQLKTKPEVIHAEANAIDKLARKGGGGEGAVMFCTHAPCYPCSLRIFGAGITELYYKDDYRSTDGIEFLRKAGVKVERIDV
ncbi:MAG: deaminase [Fischerella sp.]|nr:deaminase [Fischerella sp.]